MVLKRIEIEEKMFRPIPNDDGTADMEQMTRMKYPENVMHFYKELPADKIEEIGGEIGLWCREGIDETVNIFLKDNKITKDGLHSIETRSGTMMGFPAHAVIIYEEKEKTDFDL